MGFTRYWTFKPAPKGQAKAVEMVYQQAIISCQRAIVKAGKDIRLAGYVAHTKPGTYGGIDLNGAGEEGHENMVLREHYSQNDAFNFCKTARKPYDNVVAKCLSILKKELGDLIVVSSDDD